MDNIATKRIRKPNWTIEETQILLEELVVEGAALFGPITITNTLRMKFDVWQKIANSISSIGVALRTVDETKSKWKMLKKEAFEGDGQAQGEIKKVAVSGERLKEKFMLFKEMVRAVIDKASVSDSVHDCEPEIYFESVGQDADYLIDTNRPVLDTITTTSASSSSHVDSTVLVTSPQNNIKLEPVHAVSDVEAVMNQPAGFKARLLKRKLPLLRADIQTPKKKIQKTEDDDAESVLFKDYLKSEIKKNALICEQIRTSMEESKERQCREKEESKERLKLYRNLNKKLLGVNLLEQAGVKMGLAEHAAKMAFALDETFV